MREVVAQKQKLSADYALYRITPDEHFEEVFNAKLDTGLNPMVGLKMDVREKCLQAIKDRKAKSKKQAL